MSSGDGAQPSGSSFLFINKNATNLRSKAHAGKVNAHVHADARAKKQRAASLQTAEPFVALQASLNFSWRITDRSGPSSTDSRSTSPEASAGDLIAIDENLQISPKPSDVLSDDSASTTFESSPPTPSNVSPGESIFIITNGNEAAQQRLTQRKKRRQIPLVSASHVEGAPALARVDSTESNLSTSVATTPLDPFCSFAIDLAPQEQSLAQYYLQVMPSIVYGTRPDAIFCPVRDVTFPNMITDPLVTLWVMIGVETELIARRGLPVSPPSLLQRKAEAYRIMNDRLSDPDQKYSEKTFGGMIAATIQDARVSGSKVANLHLRGLDQQLRGRGGLKALYSDKSLIGGPILFLWCHHFSPTAGGILNTRDLKTYRQEFLQILQDMQAWNTQFQARSFRSARLPDLDNLQSVYVSTRTLVFSYSSLLRPLLDADYPCSNPVERTCHFSNLFNLNLTLWSFREDPAMGAAFLNRVLRHVELSGRVDPVTKITSLTPNALLWIIPRARREVDTKDGEEGNERDIWITWMIIHALKVVALVSDERRLKLVRIMSGWLIGGPMRSKVVEISEDEILEMNAEIRQNWTTNPD